MQKLKAKGKTQIAKVKTEEAPRDCTREAGEGSPLRPVAACPAQKLKPGMFALLIFALCVLTFAFSVCLLPTVLSAQGCAMCYTSAASARAGAKEALANGVLILLVPPMVFFALIIVVVYRYRNKFRDVSVVSSPLPIDPVIGRSGDRVNEEPNRTASVFGGLIERPPDRPFIATDN
jgi:hypothetical protein